MPKRDLEEHFADDRREWTERKHALLERYIVPGAMKIKEASSRKQVALVDGYAGPNEYGGVVAGSTAIMVKAALKVVAAGGQARVYAFEADQSRYDRLCRNLASDIENEILIVRNEKHSAGAARMLSEMSGWPMIAFLDPQTPSEMLLNSDVRIYCKRTPTDILGIFHAQNAARDAARLAKDDAAHSTVHPREYLGDNWMNATNKGVAEQVFFTEISHCKKFSGMYGLRKQDRHSDAYAIFGLSDNVHGIHLLSDAIAKDFGLIVEHDARSKGPSLFADVDAEEARKELLEIVRPIINETGHKTGQKLAIEVLRSAGNLDRVFGRYTEKDYTRAARIIKEEGNG